MTADEALDNARRLLQAAESELDLAKMKAYNDLADSWIRIAETLRERQEA